jgi:hypothetical protein
MPLKSFARIDREAIRDRGNPLAQFDCLQDESLASGRRPITSYMQRTIDVEDFDRNVVGCIW